MSFFREISNLPLLKKPSKKKKKKYIYIYIYISKFNKKDSTVGDIVQIYQ